jgi:hypothetical protein
LHEIVCEGARKVNRAPAVAVVIVASTFTMLATAQAADAPDLAFNGFGTIGVVRSSEDRADFVADTFRPEGAGHSGDWSAKVDSRLGLQLTTGLTPRLTGVAQLVLEQRYDDTFKPTVEWANLKYEFTPEFYLRAGRSVLPGVLISEYRKVGYALPWVRPPQEVYRLQALTSSDGLDAGYSYRLGEFSNTIRANVGRRDVKSPGGVESNVRDLFVLSGSAERGPLSLQLTYQHARLTVQGVEALFDAFRQFGPEGEEIADRFDFDRKTVEFVGFGASYDSGDWFLMSEFAKFYSRTFLGDSHGWYVTGGYRLGDFTPYLTVARMQVDTATSHPGLTLDGLPPPLVEIAAGLNAALNHLLETSPAQKSISLGTRWDFARNLALKAQFDYLDLHRDSPGVLVNEQPDFRRGGSVSLFSLALDFVF